MTTNALPVVKRPLTSAIHHGDCQKVLTTFPDKCVDLIVTSPPYADQRSQTYGGIHLERPRLKLHDQFHLNAEESMI